MNSGEVASVVAGLPDGFVGVVGGGRWEHFRAVSPGHVARLSVDCDWGGPCDWQAVCSCGWAGSVGTDSSRGPAGSYEGSFAEACAHAGVTVEGERARVASVVRSLLGDAGRLVAAGADVGDAAADGVPVEDVADLVVEARAVLDRCAEVLESWRVTELALVGSAR